MLYPSEQIDAILSLGLFKLMKSNSTIGQMKFVDVISVSESDIAQYVAKNGFNPRIVSNHIREDRRCIIQEGDKSWRTFYYERGNRISEKRHSTKQEAEIATIRSLILTNKITVNPSYRHKHPEENLPMPSEM